MSGYLKGNYTVRRKKGTLTPRSPRKRNKETPQEEFERRALEQLGGSISFVIKPTFVWNGDQSGESR